MGSRPPAGRCLQTARVGAPPHDAPKTGPIPSRGRSLGGMLIVAAVAVVALLASDLQEMLNRPSR